MVYFLCETTVNGRVAATNENNRVYFRAKWMLAETRDTKTFLQMLFFKDRNAK